jgi:hypothetical protein
MVPPDPPARFVAVVAEVAVAALPPILKFATAVVEVTTNGAVPVAMVEVICPLVLMEVGVIAPNPIVKAGVVVDVAHVAVTPLLAAAVDTDVTVPVAAATHEGASVVPLLCNT